VEDVSDAERHGTAAFNTLLDEELMAGTSARGTSVTRGERSNKYVS
jgi:hypothetical protein